MRLTDSTKALLEGKHVTSDLAYTSRIDEFDVSSRVDEHVVHQMVEPTEHEAICQCIVPDSTAGNSLPVFGR